MTGFSDSTDVRAVVNDDRTEARLIAPAGTDLTALTPEFCFVLLSGRGVRITGEVGRAVEGLISRIRTGERDLSGGVLVARAKPARPGTDGSLTWLVDEPDPGAGGAEAVSFYDQSAFVFVEEGQHIGELIEPTPGEDGFDVLGGTIAARPGRRVPIKLDDSILRDASGRLIAQVHGVLQRTGTSARVTPAVEVPGAVDFSSGNIDFDGDTVVRDGVCDCFHVRVTGDADISGLIEAAEVRCGGSLTARAGMAGRGKGVIDVGGDASTRYLDGVRGSVQGDLSVEREIIDCRLKIGGSLNCPNGTIIGSEIAVAGKAVVGTLGAPSDKRTSITLGTMPILEDRLKALRSTLKKDQAKRDRVVAEKQQLESFKRRLTSDLRERLTELYFEFQEVESRIRELEAEEHEVTETISARRSVSFDVNRELHANVRLILDEQSYRVMNSVRGPLHIGLDEQRHAVFRRGNGRMQPLTDIAVPLAPQDDSAHAA